jgi:hypothetical protein
LTRKVSRAALVAGLAIGASGLVAVPAEAANGIATANYYVNQPAVTGAAAITPESAVVTGAIDTGGNPETLLPVPTGGLSWDGNISISAGAKWVDNTTGNFVPVDGLPVNDSFSNVSVTITDNTTTPPYNASTITGVPIAVSNGGADNYSDITFEYDPVSDYDAVDGQPGPNVQFAQDVQVPTSAGLSPVTTTLGAFGLTAQNNTGNTPLTPGTKYYYWIVQQAGATDAATNVDISSWSGGANPSDKCYPNVAIAQDPTLAGYNAATQITALNAAVPPVLAAAPGLQGPCIYYYGNTGGQLYYQSPNGTFSTPKLGNLTIGKTAIVLGKKATVTIGNGSPYKASGTLQLTTKAGKVLANGKFALAASQKSGKVTFTLTGAGVTAAKKKQAGTVILTSNWDQKSATKSIKL